MNLIQKTTQRNERLYKHASNFPSKFEFTGNRKQVNKTEHVHCFRQQFFARTSCGNKLLPEIRFCGNKMLQQILPEPIRLLPQLWQYCSFGAWYFWQQIYIAAILLQYCRNIFILVREVYEVEIPHTLPKIAESGVCWGMS